jgi:hypothetical protein
MATSFRLASIALIAATILITGCSSPTEPSPVLTISTPTPAPGAVVPIIPIGFQSFIERGNGVFSVPITVTSDREVPWAQLRVYLNRAGGLGSESMCGHNLPDAPTWGPFRKGQTASVTISGWQFSGPCQVTSITAYLHTRNNGLNLPPTQSETVASGALSVNYTFR